MLRNYFPAQRPLPPATTLEEIVIKSLQKFSRQRLYNSLDARRAVRGSLANNPEAVYQNELYRTMFKVSNGAIIPVPEFFVGYGTGQRGRVDFFDASRRWGIEALVDSDGVEAHYGRFVGNGKYVQANLSDFIVLNFRKGIPRTTYGIFLSVLIPNSIV